MTAGIVHAVPLPRPSKARDHQASSLCWCRPVAALRDLETTRTVYVHRDGAGRADTHEAEARP